MIFYLEKKKKDSTGRDDRERRVIRVHQLKAEWTQEHDAALGIERVVLAIGKREE